MKTVLKTMLLFGGLALSVSAQARTLDTESSEVIFSLIERLDEESVQVSQDFVQGDFVANYYKLENARIRIGTALNSTSLSTATSRAFDRSPPRADLIQAAIDLGLDRDVYSYFGNVNIVCEEVLGAPEGLYPISCEMEKVVAE